MGRRCLFRRRKRKPRRGRRIRRKNRRRDAICFCMGRVAKPTGRSHSSTNCSVGVTGCFERYSSSTRRTKSEVVKSNSSAASSTRCLSSGDMNMSKRFVWMRRRAMKTVCLVERCMSRTAYMRFRREHVCKRGEHRFPTFGAEPGVRYLGLDGKVVWWRHCEFCGHHEGLSRAPPPPERLHPSAYAHELVAKEVCRRCGPVKFFWCGEPPTFSKLIFENGELDAWRTWFGKTWFQDATRRCRYQKTIWPRAPKPRYRWYRGAWCSQQKGLTLP